MAFPSITNVSGINPGPNPATIPDTVQSPIGNVQKTFRAALVIVPAALATGPSVNVQTFAATGIGLLATDAVTVAYAGVQTAAVAILDARVSALDTLEIKFFGAAGTPTPAAGTVAVPYVVTVIRVQPNWVSPGFSTQITF